MKQNQAIFLKFYTLIQHDHASITLKPVYTLLSHSWNKAPGKLKH